MLQSQKAKKKKIDAKCENEGEKQWDSILKRERGYLQKILDKLSSEYIFIDGAGYLQNFETSYWLYSENRLVKSYHSGYLQKLNWSNSMNQAIFRKFL